MAFLPIGATFLARPADGLRRAFDLGIVTTAIICATLVGTVLLDYFTTTDLRLPLRLIDLACVVALLVWQFKRIRQQRARDRLLRVAHAKLDVALRAAGLGVWEWELASNCLEVDATTRDLLAIVDAELRSDALFANVHEEDVGKVSAALDAARRHGESVQYEFRLVDAAGEERWIEGVASSQGAPDKPQSLIGAVRDITDRRRSRDALANAKFQAELAAFEMAQSRLNLDLALGAGGLGVWQCSALIEAGNTILQHAFLEATFTADATARESCGFASGAEMSVEAFLRVIHPDDRGRVIATLDRVHAPGTHPYRDQYRVVHADGDIRTLDVRGSVTSVALGEHRTRVSLIGIVKDVTQEEALKASLLAKAEEARLARDAKSRFLAMMSHEVRTPMNGVLGMLDLVIDMPLQPEQRRMLLRCKQSAQALLTIVNDVLDFSKIEAGKLSLESTSLSLRSLVEDVCADFALQAARKTVSLDHHIDVALPQFVLGDPVRIRQVLTNLIANAIKFTATGTVRVRAHAYGDDAWSLEVEDTGAGIAPAAMAQLFRPFQQADASTTRRYGGTGLGLSIVKQLVELMEGTVACQSTLGRGSCFRVVLPLRPWVPGLPGADAVASVADTSSAPVHAALPPKRVLLAEDNPINQDVIRLQLARLGHQCDCAEDGEAAWRLLQTPGLTFDALITDGDMPRLDGFGLAERVRAWELRHVAPRLPILAMTANALRGDRERCLAAGMDGYVSKPVSLQALQQALADLFAEGGNASPPGIPEPVAATESSDAYAHLRTICADNPVTIANVIQTFLASVGQDAALLHAAYWAGSVDRARHLAHRMASGCLQLGERNAQLALQCVEDAQGLQDMRDAYPRAEAALREAVDRARAYLDEQSLRA